MRIRAAAGLFVCALLLGLQACGGPGSSVTQPALPTFTTIDVPGGSLETGALDINLGGDIAGLFKDSNGVLHSYLRSSGGTFTVFDPPLAPTETNEHSQALGINRSGSIVGFFFGTAFEHGYIRAADGTFTTFDVPGSTSTSASSINDTGAVAGSFNDASGTHAYVRASDGTFTTFDSAGGAVQFLLPSRINAGGAVVGFFLDSNFAFHGFLRAADGTLTVLDAPNAPTVAGTGTEASDINASGVIVGVIEDGLVGGLGTSHSFVRATDGTYTVFDPPEAGSHGSLAEGINDQGAIVGRYLDANLVAHGYLRNPDGTFITLDDPNAGQLPASLANIGTAPRRINSGGAVVGVYSDATGARHGFVRD